MPWMEAIQPARSACPRLVWFDSFQARAARWRRVPVRPKLLLLDDTVALGGLRPARDDNGRLRLRRVYHFSTTIPAIAGKGYITLLGNDLLLLHRMRQPSYSGQWQRASPLTAATGSGY
jgi:hypothetical protein